MLFADYYNGSFGHDLTHVPAHATSFHFGWRATSRMRSFSSAVHDGVARFVMALSLHSRTPAGRGRRVTTSRQPKVRMARQAQSL